MQREAIARVIAAYDAPIIRAYSRGRFLILRQRFLDEIGQYLPDEGVVLDVGCGFGLFSLYYAQLVPGARFCSECGTPQGNGSAPASTAAPVAARRVTSVLFGDLVGFTSLCLKPL